MDGRDHARVNYREADEQGERGPSDYGRADPTAIERQKRAMVNG